MIIEVMKKIKPFLPLKVIKLLSFAYYRLYMRVLCAYLDYKEDSYCKKVGLPSASLRYRVNGVPQLSRFLSEGERCSTDIENALASIGKNLHSFSNVLDFGCGCGRTVRWFSKYAAKSSFHGTDIDSAAVAYCRSSFSDFEFDVNGELPPLKYPAASFDLIYSISVFTHINEDYQQKWLAELRRVLKDGGILLLSLHGSHSWSNLPSKYVDAITAAGHLYVTDDVWKGIFPCWYQTAFHTEDYARHEFSRYFSVIDYIPQGISGYQDLVILQKVT